MPYIPEKDREKYYEDVCRLVDTLWSNNNGAGVKVGDVNYIISTLIWKLFANNKSYTNGNNLMGVLECVKQEFYRRQLAIYEDQKIVENGDIH